MLDEATAIILTSPTITIETMDIYGAQKLHFYDIDEASEHFKSYDNFMSIVPVLERNSRLRKKVLCIGYVIRKPFL